MQTWLTAASCWFSRRPENVIFEHFCNWMHSEPLFDVTCFGRAVVWQEKQKDVLICKKNIKLRIFSCETAAFFFPLQFVSNPWPSCYKQTFLSGSCHRCANATKTRASALCVCIISVSVTANWTRTILEPSVSFIAFSDVISIRSRCLWWKVGWAAGRKTELVWGQRFRINYPVR